MLGLLDPDPDVGGVQVYGGEVTGETPRCVNCGAGQLPSGGWHLDPDTLDYTCHAR